MDASDNNGLPRERTKTGYVFHEKYMWHNPGDVAFSPWIQPCRHWEHTDTKRRMHNLVAASGLLDQLQIVAPRSATEAELCYFHAPEYVSKVKTLSAASGGEVGDETSIAKGGFEIAALAAGGAIAAIDAVLSGKCVNAYALVRPPGHHATRDAGAGFCVFNNVVLAAEHAFRKWDDTVKCIAVVDFDAHHGNGTQEAYEKDDRVLFISVHQDRNYPQNSGSLSECGSGAGECFTINVPLPAGSGRGAYAMTMDRVVVRAIDAFKPDLIIASCGFDASYMDPLARMMLGSKDFADITATLSVLAFKHCRGRLVMVHEGGYSDIYVPFCGVATIQALSGAVTEVEDPMLSEQQMMGGQALQPHQMAVIEESAKVVDRLKERLKKTRRRA